MNANENVLYADEQLADMLVLTNFGDNPDPSEHVFIDAGDHEATFETDADVNLMHGLTETPARQRRRSSLLRRGKAGIETPQNGLKVMHFQNLDFMLTDLCLIQGDSEKKPSETESCLARASYCTVDQANQSLEARSPLRIAIRQRTGQAQTHPNAPSASHKSSP